MFGKIESTTGMDINKVAYSPPNLEPITGSTIYHKSEGPIEYNDEIKPKKVNENQLLLDRIDKLENMIVALTDKVVNLEKKKTIEESQKKRLTDTISL